MPLPLQTSFNFANDDVPIVNKIFMSLLDIASSVTVPPSYMNCLTLPYTSPPEVTPAFPAQICRLSLFALSSSLHVRSITSSSLPATRYISSAKYRMHTVPSYPLIVSLMIGFRKMLAVVGESIHICLTPT